MKHAWFSASNCKEYGYAIYLDENGKEIQVTGVADTYEAGDACYKWEDKEYIGMVDKWVSTHHTPRYEMMMRHKELRLFPYEK